MWCTEVGQRLLERTTVICVDHDGHGLTDWSRAERGMQGYVDDIAVVLKRLEVPRCTVIGHSMSGVSLF